jgi:hypothetical protein
LDLFQNCVIVARVNRAGFLEEGSGGREIPEKNGRPVLANEKAL